MITISGPVWVDGCNHPKEAYVGSFKSLHFKPELREASYDLYVFDSPSGQEVCIRYGNEPQEYYSPGPLVQFIQLASRWYEKAVRHYVDALEILKEKGVFSWKKSIVDSAQLGNAGGQITPPF
jgi:hypothetical protein